MFNLFCLSCIQLFSNSRAASRASQSSSSRTSDSSSCVNYQVKRAKTLPKPRWHTALQRGLSDLNTQHSAVLQLSLQGVSFLSQHLSLLFLALGGGISALQLCTASFQRIQTHRHTQQVFSKILKNLLTLLSGFS